MTENPVPVGAVPQTDTHSHEIFSVLVLSVEIFSVLVLSVFAVFGPVVFVVAPIVFTLIFILVTFCAVVAAFILAPSVTNAPAEPS